ncbi:UNVERIFIED_CONTAM: hypothetical protein FKN15_035140 [Acipenser sinensis]
MEQNCFREAFVNAFFCRTNANFFIKGKAAGSTFFILGEKEIAWIVGDAFKTKYKDNPKRSAQNRRF